MPTELSIANDGSNETITIKKRLRVSQITIRRGATIMFSTERANINNADDQDRSVNSGPQVIRQVEAMIADASTVTVDGKDLTFQNVWKALGKFHDKWRAEDIAAQNP